MAPAKLWDSHERLATVHSKIAHSTVIKRIFLYNFTIGINLNEIWGKLKVLLKNWMEGSIFLKKIRLNEIAENLYYALK